jgi:hypothetical protein
MEVTFLCYFKILFGDFKDTPWRAGDELNKVFWMVNVFLLCIVVQNIMLAIFVKVWDSVDSNEETL